MTRDRATVVTQVLVDALVDVMTTIIRTEFRRRITEILRDEFRPSGSRALLTAGWTTHEMAADRVQPLT